MNGENLPRPLAWAWDIAPGLLICIIIALASTFVSEHYGGPTLLYALLLGMAFYFLSKNPRTRSGIQFGSRTVLRLGVALARTTSGTNGSWGSAGCRPDSRSSDAQAM